MISASKLIPTLFVAAAFVASVSLRPPRAEVGGAELVRLVVAVSVLYVVGGIALLWHRTDLAGVVFGVGLVLCGLAVWLSRAAAPPSPEDDGGGQDAPIPPPEPTDLDWSFFEDQFREPVA